MAEPLPSLCPHPPLAGSMPNKSALALGIQTDFFFNYQLVVIKACCMYFTPLFLVFIQSRVPR